MLPEMKFQWKQTYLHKQKSNIFVVIFVIKWL